VTFIPNEIRQSYDVRFKLIVINYTENTNNCNAARTSNVGEEMYGGGNKGRSLKTQTPPKNLPVAPLMGIQRTGNC
jgi:hypothetical protein